MTKRTLSIIATLISLNACGPKPSNNSAGPAEADHSSLMVSEAELNQNGCRFSKDSVKFKLACARPKSILAKYNQIASVSAYFSQLHLLKADLREKNETTKLSFALKELHLTNYKLAHKTSWAKPTVLPVLDGVTREPAAEQLWYNLFTKLAELALDDSLVVRFAAGESSVYPTAARVEIYSPSSINQIELGLKSIEDALTKFETQDAESNPIKGDVEAIRAVIKVIRADLSLNGVK